MLGRLSLSDGGSLERFQPLSHLLIARVVRVDLGEVSLRARLLPELVVERTTVEAPLLEHLRIALGAPERRLVDLERGFAHPLKP